LLFLTAHFASKLLIAFGSLLCSKFCWQIWSRPRVEGPKVEHIHSTPYKKEHQWFAYSTEGDPYL